MFAKKSRRFSLILSVVIAVAGAVFARKRHNEIDA
jgi:hypothetical protein